MLITQLNFKLNTKLVSKHSNLKFFFFNLIVLYINIFSLYNAFSEVLLLLCGF